MKALVIGLGRAGLSAGRYLGDRGWEVVGCDRKPETDIFSETGSGLNGLPGGFDSGSKGLPPGFVTAVWGSEDPRLLGGVGLVVPSPGVPPWNPLLVGAAKAGIPVKGEAALALEEVTCPVIVITGTNGKTTTTQLTGELFSSCGLRAVVCGNNGLPVTEAFGAGWNWDAAIVEMSSFMIDRKGIFVPRAAAILNMTPDHLDRYATADEYYASKMALADGMDSRGAIVANADCPETISRVRKLASSGWKGRLLTFSRLDPSANCHAFGSTVTVAHEGRRFQIDISGRAIRGDHNVENILAAILLCAEMGLAASGMEAGIRSFRPVEHRIEPVRELNGITFVNDSKGTNPDSTIKAIRSFDGHLSLILGGYDKGSDFGELAREIVGRGCVSVVLVGQTAENIFGSLETAGYGAAAPVAGDLGQAVALARELARTSDKGSGTVLFSPACASYDMFKNFEERGKMFKTIVRSLT